MAAEPIYVTPRRFDVHHESEEMLEHLHSQGYAVCRALSEEESDVALNGLWEHLTLLGTGIDRSQPMTWGDERWPRGVAGGILPYHGVGQSKVMWYLRTHPAVLRAFSAIWGVEQSELLCSFDGMCAFRPWQIDSGWRTQGGWYHVDQNPALRPAFDCVQGLVNFGPKTSMATGGNVLIPRSHLQFSRLAETYAEAIDKLNGADFFSLPREDPMLCGGSARSEPGPDDGAEGEAAAGGEAGVDEAEERASASGEAADEAADKAADEAADEAAAAQLQPIICRLERGDLLLWESRTVHCSAPGRWPPKKPEESEMEEVAEAKAQLKKQELLRATGFVCMVPRSKACDEVLFARKIAVLDRRSTTHRPHLFQPTDQYDSFLSIPERILEKYSWAPPPDLSEEAALLVGFTENEIRERLHKDLMR